MVNSIDPVCRTLIYPVYSQDPAETIDFEGFTCRANRAPGWETCAGPRTGLRYQHLQILKMV